MSKKKVDEKPVEETTDEAAKAAEEKADQNKPAETGHRIKLVKGSVTILRDSSLVSEYLKKGFEEV